MSASVVGDSSPISSKKVSRKRAIIDDDSDEDITPPVIKHDTKQSPPSGDVDQPCSSSSLQTSPSVLSTPPKRVTGIVFVYETVNVHVVVNCVPVLLLYV